MDEGLSGIASTLKNLQEAANSGGDEQLRALSHKIKESFRKGLRHALVESTTDIYGLFGASMTDPLDFSSGMDDGWGGYPYTSPAYYIQNMKRGEVLPAYLYEQQLRIYRDRSRKLCQENEYTICAIENRKNYAVGAEGFQYKAVSAKAERYEGMDKLLSRAQWVTDHWVEHNDMAEYAKDVMIRLDKDGEAFTRYFAQASGLVTIRTVEAEHVRAPSAEYGPKYSFGIQCDPEDVETREGYWIVEDPSKGWVPNFVPAEEVCHIKINTPRSAKRGLPTFYPCEQLLRIASDLLVGVAKNANHRAKIAMVRTVTGAMASAAQSMIDELKDVQIMDPATGNTVNVEKFNWGTILTQPDSVKTEFPNANFDSNNFDTALQMILRAVAARLVMPEWMLTVNAQNSNFSSSLIAEAPSTKAFEDLQQMLLKRIGTNRMRSRESMLWYQIRHAVRVGLLPPETLMLVKIECQGPSLIVRDKTGEASQNKLYYDMRAKSKRIIQMENNWDPEQVKKDFEEDDAEQLKLQAVQAQQEMKIQQAQMQQQAEASLLGMAPNAEEGGGGPPPDDGGDGEAPPQQFPESGPNGGPGAGRLPAREGLEEVYTESQLLLEAGFTGVVKDKKGVEYHYVNGKRVAAGHHQPTAQVTKIQHTDDLDDKKADAYASGIKTAAHKIAAILAHKPMTAGEIFQSMGGVGTHYNAIKALIQAGVVAKNGQNQFVLVPKGGGQPAATPQTPKQPPAGTPTPATPAQQTPNPTQSTPSPPAPPTPPKNPYASGSVGHTLFDTIAKAGGSVTAPHLFKTMPGGKTYYNALKAMVTKGHIEKTASGAYQLPKGGGTSVPAQAQTTPTPTPTKEPEKKNIPADEWVAANISKDTAYYLATGGSMVTYYNMALGKGMDPNTTLPQFKDAVKEFSGHKATPKQPTSSTEDKPQNPMAKAKVLKSLGGSADVKKVEIDGKLYAAKTSDAGQLAAEAAADKIYQIMGAAIAPATYHTEGSSTTKVSEFVDGKELNDFAEGTKPQIYQELRKHLVTDALLANYDVLGTGHNNIIVKGFDTYRIDNGGSFDYRAAAKDSSGKPKKKAFTDDAVADLKSMQDPSVNHWAAAAFNGITEEEIKSQVAEVVKNKDAIIAATPKQHQATMVKRIESLAKAYPLAKQEPEKPKVDPSKFPPEPSFESKNQANTTKNKADVKVLLEMAAKGDVAGINAFQSPSPKVTSFKEELASIVHSQLNPPKPPVPYDGSLHEIKQVFKDVHEAAKAVGYKPENSQSSSTLTPSQIGHYIVLGDVGVPEYDPAPLWHASSTKTDPAFDKQHAEAFNAMPEKAKARLKKLKGSSSGIHTPFWGGELGDADKAVTKALKEHAPELPPGTRLRRHITLEKNQVLALQASVGKVLQEPAMSETSISKDWGWSGNVHFEMITAPGSKGLYINAEGALSVFDSEKSLVLPPGSRYLIKDAVMKGGTLHVKAIVLPTVDGQFPV